MTNFIQVPLYLNHKRHLEIGSRIDSQLSIKHFRQRSMTKTPKNVTTEVSFSRSPRT